MAAGDGHQDTGLLPEQVAAIRRSLNALDPMNDEHWGEDGKPSIEVMAAATGIPALNRAMIDAVMPDFNREVAAEI